MGVKEARVILNWKDEVRGSLEVYYFIKNEVCSAQQLKDLTKV